MSKLTLPIEIGKTYLRRDGIMIKFERIEVNNTGESIAHPKSRLNICYIDSVYSKTGKNNFNVANCGADVISDYIEVVEEFKVGDIVKITQSDSEFFNKNSIARLSIKNEDNSWWADFKDCGNIRGSYNDGHDGIWCIGTASPDKFIHTKPLDVEEKAVGHVHAANMLLYAQDAAETDKPWERWECASNSQLGMWASYTGDASNLPLWLPSLQYRRKPPVPKFILINGHQVPEPLRVVPAYGTPYYAAALGECFSTIWIGFQNEFNLLNNGQLHLTKEAAETHRKALLSFTKVE